MCRVRKEISGCLGLGVEVKEVKTVMGTGSAFGIMKVLSTEMVAQPVPVLNHIFWYVNHGSIRFL